MSVSLASGEVGHAVSNPAKEGEVTQHGIDKVERYGWVVVDDPGEFRLIHKNRLVVDGNYQRTDIVESKIIRMASRWSHIACGVILVADRGGTYYVMDGQNRTLAARRRSDISHMPCLVFKSSGRVQEAEGFLASNTERRPLRASDRHKALVVTGDKAALVVDELIKESGRRAASTSGPYTVQCLTMMLSSARNREAELRRLWPLIVELCEGEALHSRIVASFVYIESRLPEDESLTKPRWRKRLLQIGYNNLLDAMAKASAYHANGGARVWADGVLTIINRGLRNELSLESK